MACFPQGLRYDRPHWIWRVRKSFSGSVRENARPLSSRVSPRDDFWFQLTSGACWTNAFTLCGTGEVNYCSNSIGKQVYCLEMASLGFASIVIVVCHAVSAEGHCQLQPSLELYPWGKFLTGTPHQPGSNVPLGSSNLAHQALILHMMKQSSYEVIRITQTIYWKAQYDQPWNIHHVQWAFHLPWTLSLAKCIPQSIEADPRIYNWRYSSTRIYGFLMPFNYFQYFQNFRMMHLEKRVYIYNYILYVFFFDHGNF